MEEEEIRTFSFSLTKTQSPESEEETHEKKEEVVSKSKPVYAFSRSWETSKNIIRFEDEPSKVEGVAEEKPSKPILFHKAKATVKGPARIRELFRQRRSFLRTERSPLIFESNGSDVRISTSRDRLIKALRETSKHINETETNDESEEVVQKESGQESGQESGLAKGIFVTPPQIPKKGISFGYFISRIFLLPVLPRICGGDLLFFVQLITSLILLILSLVNQGYSSNLLFVYLSIAFSAVFLLMVIIDGFCYEFHFFKYTRTRCERKEPGCFCFPEFTIYNYWYEIIRTIASELLLYPLIILCLFELMNCGDFDLTSTEQKLVFSIFMISCAYIILSVYIMRFLMVIVTIIRLLSISLTSDHSRLFVVFLFHIIVQIIIQILAVASVAAKIELENNGHCNSYVASPFLWVVIIAAWIIPLMGTLSFVVTNYYWLKIFSLEIFIDVVGCLEQQEVAEAVFDEQDPAEESGRLIRITRYSEIKQQARRIQDESSFVVKFLYPLSVPLFILYAVVFEIVVAVFIVCLLLGPDKSGYVVPECGTLCIFTDLFIVIGNFQILLLIDLWIGAILIPLLITAPIWIIIWIKKLLPCSRKYEEISNPI